jgi:transposase
MKFIQHQDRKQTSIFPVSIDATISQDNEVRIIDLFVESLSLQEYGFDMVFIENGRPAYHPSDLLKLYIYGYLNKIRSSRELEKECLRNIEVMWLLHMLQPDHNTISNFRMNNEKAIKKVFRATVQIARHFDLIGGKLVAGDSTKLRAQNSKKNNYNQSKIEQHIAYIDNKLEEYNNELSKADGDKEKIKSEIEKHNKRKDNYKKLEQQLNKTGEAQISTSDTDSRQMIIRNSITEVAYNVQTTVDAKNNIPIDYKVTNNNDSKAMGNMLRRAKSILGSNEFTALYDKGYHTGTELKIAQELGIETIVAIPDKSSSSMAPNHAYNVSEFKYDPKSDTYTCIQGHILSTNGNWYNKSYRNTTVMTKHYKTPKCKSCPVVSQCTRNAQRGRVIERSQYAPFIEQNKRNVERYEQFYKRRQSIVEHPYGTIKRQWGFYYIITKQGMERASADVGLMFIAYNLRRIINILGQDLFKKYLKQLALLFFKLFSHIRLKKLQYEGGIFFKINRNTFILPSLNRFILAQIIE